MEPSTRLSIAPLRDNFETDGETKDICKRRPDQPHLSTSEVSSVGVLDSFTRSVTLAVLINNYSSYVIPRLLSLSKGLLALENEEKMTSHLHDSKARLSTVYRITTERGEKG
ncbi:hypothetical protein TNCV_129611 [Trichonephila clavipes]|nr:hypothetical protein TNCV_129611 [Trichonephila clavipes]